MVNLFITVLAIALAALFVAGGINYINTDLLIKIDHSHMLQRQYQMYVNGISTYRNANNGYIPSSINALKGFIPEIPASAGKFGWSINGRTLCLQKENEAVLSDGILMSVFTFAKQRKDQGGVEINYGSSCADAASGTKEISDGGFTVDFIKQEPTAAIIIARF